MREKAPAANLKQQWASYARISDELKRAVIVAEDAKFSEHDGFDWEGIQKALEKNQRRGKVVAGGSPISQQLGKNLLLSGEKSLWRKGQEAVITWMLEMLMDKERILEIYLNVAEWGNGVFGAEAAARHYYNVSAASRRRSFTIRIFRTSNHHRQGTTPSSARIRSKANLASGWSSSSNAQQAVIDASRTNAIRPFVPHCGPTAVRQP